MKKLIVAVLVVVGFTTFAQNTPNIEYFDNGNIKAKYSTIEEGLTKVTFYFEEGGVRETGYVQNDQRTGSWESFDRNGNKLCHGFYSENEKVGSWTFWSSTGDVYSTLIYNDNEVVSYNVNNDTPAIAYTSEQ